MFTSINPATGMAGASYPALTLADTELRIEVMGECFPALRHTRPPYDPERSAILA